MPYEPIPERNQTSPGRRHWWVVGGVLAGLAIAIALWWRSDALPPESGAEPGEAKAEASGGSGNIFEIEPDIQRAVGLADQAVEQRSVTETIQTTAVVGPDETRIARIRPLAEGRVTQVAVRVGDRVATGQALLVYDSITAGQLTSEYRAAIASLARATAEADVARRSLERADNLVELGGVARGERERRSAEHQRAVADVNGAGAAVTNLEQRLARLGVSRQELDRIRDGGDMNTVSRGVVSAPFAGVVLEVHAAPGEIITQERELFTVADLSRVWVQADVYQKDIARIRVGENALVTVDAYPGETFTGKVTHVGDVLDPNTRTAKVRCELLNRDGRLKFQMFASLALPVSAPHDALVIPSRAVQDIDGVPTVFVRIDDERFQPRPVRLGVAAGDSVEVQDGLKPGESVVTDGALMLKSRLKLRVEEEEEEKR